MTKTTKLAETTPITTKCDSMEQMSSQWKIPREALRAAKKAGCSFVQHGRCDVPTFIAWWFAQGDSGDCENWDMRFKRGRALTVETALAREQGSLVEAAAVRAALAANLARARVLLDASFRSELPAKQGGMPADKIAAMNEERLNEIYSIISKPIS